LLCPSVVPLRWNVQNAIVCQPVGALWLMFGARQPQNIDVGQSEAGISTQPLDETGRSVREELIRLSENVHALSYRLHPSILEDLGLAAALIRRFIATIRALASRACESGYVCSVANSKSRVRPVMVQPCGPGCLSEYLQANAELVTGKSKKLTGQTNAVGVNAYQHFPKSQCFR